MNGHIEFHVTFYLLDYFPFFKCHVQEFCFEKNISKISLWVCSVVKQNLTKKKINISYTIMYSKKKNSKNIVHKFIKNMILH